MEYNIKQKRHTQWNRHRIKIWNRNGMHNGPEIEYKMDRNEKQNGTKMGLQSGTENVHTTMEQKCEYNGTKWEYTMD
jgi:hypothetical protein